MSKEQGTGETPSQDVSVFLDADVKDDVVVPFQAEKAGARGRLLRLGDVVNQILSAHDYPDGVANFLGEAIAMAAMVGSLLKFDGKLILQTKTDGPISMLVVDFSTPSSLRAYASFDKAHVSELEGEPYDLQTWLGQGVLALTIDQGPDMERYQGIVALDKNTLGEVAEAYFAQSEQIPSLVRLHVAKHFSSEQDDGTGWHWRAGGLMVQHLTAKGGLGGAQAEVLEDDLEDENWNRAKILGSSVEPHELLDPQLAPERLLFRLYHEEGVRVFDPLVLDANCSCSEERVRAMLAKFSASDRDDMIDQDGKISVTCEFCTKRYEFDLQDFV